MTSLAVFLVSGKGYRYAQVSLQAFNNFRDAESAGKHHNTYFKPFSKQAARQSTLRAWPLPGSPCSWVSGCPRYPRAAVLAKPYALHNLRQALDVFKGHLSN